MILTIKNAKEISLTNEVNALINELEIKTAIKIHFSNNSTANISYFLANINSALKK